jgi:cation diffusion facilitator family transporter
MSQTIAKAAMPQIEPETIAESADMGSTDQRRRLALVSLSLLIGAFLMALKFYAYSLTHSSAILSDALESIINVVACTFALGSILLATRPPDESHPYGHGKIEFFSAGFEGALIIVAAFGIFKTGVPRLFDPAPLAHLNFGLVLLISASFINFFMGIGLIRVGRQTGSIILVADGKHLLTDVYTTVGVVLGLVLVKTTGWLWLDGLIACIVGLNILATGFSLVRQSFQGLMDAADKQILKGLSELLIKNRKTNWVDIHQLRAWKSGDHTHIDLHLVLPRDCSLEQAHAEAKEVENILIKHFKGRASALIHMDPCIDDDCPVCHENECRLRGRHVAADEQWSLSTITTRKSAQWHPAAKKSES